MRIYTFCTIFKYYEQNVSSNKELINSGNDVLGTEFEDILII